MRNRLLLSFVCLLFLGSLAAAYAGGGKEKPAPETKKPSVQKVTLLHFMGEQTKRNGLKQLCDAVTAKNPNIVFEIEGVAYAQYTGILKTRLAADDAPDLFTGWPNQYVEIIRAGQVMDLSAKAPGQKIIPWLAKECTVDGKLSGIPLDVQMYGAFYNKDVFDKFGLKVPATFSELIKVCDTLMANKVYPFVRSYKNANFPWVEYTCFAYPLLCQDPSTKNILWRSIFEKKAKFADYPAFVETLKIYDKLLKYTEPGDMGLDSAQGIMKLAKGERAMTTDGAWITGDLYAANPNGRFGFFAPPWSDDPAKNRAGSGLDDVFMAYAKTKNAEGVDKFFETVVSDEGSRIWMETAKMLSAVKGAPIPKNNDVQQDIAAILNGGKDIQRSNLSEFAGEYRQKMRARIQLFAAMTPAERNIDKFVKDLDAEFALIK